MILSGKQRYRQATLKGRLLSERSARAYERGEAPYIEGWRTREFLEAEIERAYQAGLADGRREATDAA